MAKAKQLSETKKLIILSGNSLSLFPPESMLRLSIQKLISNKLFELFILLNVAISSILMIFDSPLSDQKSLVIMTSTYVNIIVTIVFTIECLLKWIVYGVINNGPNSYFKDGWNLLDFFITLLSLLSIAFDYFVVLDQNLVSQANKLELVKILRVLRSVRLITTSQALKISIVSLIYAIPGIADLAIVIFMFFLLFGIFFLNLFKGKFYSCTFSGGLDEFIYSQQVIT